MSYTLYIVSKSVLYALDSVKKCLIDSLSVLSKVIMADPPWDIHMDLPYGTMLDDEMRKMGVRSSAARGGG